MLIFACTLSDYLSIMLLTFWYLLGEIKDYSVDSKYAYLFCGIRYIFTVMEGFNVNISKYLELVG